VGRIITTETSNGNPVGAPPKGQLRLTYLDGLRALAALYVVLFHAGVGFTTDQLPPWAFNLRRILTYGHDAVAVFIVLSGYCLMLPVVRGDGHLVGGMPRYIGRRAWRILPAYYGAVLGSLLLLWLVPVLRTHTGTIWDDSSPAFEWGPVATHLLLIHNLFPAWIFRINGPLWSVATEWQIYFFFPLLLLPVWRRVGLLATLLVGFAVGCAPLWLAPGIAGKAIPWYLGLFAMGMSAAAVGFSPRVSERRVLACVPWKFVVLVFALGCMVWSIVFASSWFRWMPLSDALVGATTGALLVHYSECLMSRSEQERPAFLRLLEARLLAGIGRFSYSLYLTHLPVVALCYFALKRTALSGQAQMIGLILVSVPASLGVALAFFWAVERRSLGRRAAAVKKL
jgi:peptidoglycan/LPS O-acetylase OafA/YrhL